MALEKQRMYRKNIDGTKDLIYRETSSDLVKHGDTDLNTKINGIDSSLADIEKKVHLNILDYDIILGDITDVDVVSKNSIELQKALDFACNNNLMLEFPSQTICYDTTINITKKCTLNGNGVTLKYLGKDIAISFYSNDKNNIPYSQIKNLNIIALNSVCAIKQNRFVHTTFEDIYIKATNGTGWIIEGKSDDISPYNSAYNNRYVRVRIEECLIGFDVNAVISDCQFSIVGVVQYQHFGFLFTTDKSITSWNVSFDECTFGSRVDVGNVAMDLRGTLRNMEIKNSDIERCEYGIRTDIGNNEYKRYITITNCLFIYNKNAITFQTTVGCVSNNCFFGSNPITDIYIKDTTISYFISNQGINRAIIKTINSQSFYFEYKYAGKQDTYVFNSGISLENKDFVLLTPGKGVIMTSPNGTNYRIKVNDIGEIETQIIT